MKLAIYCAGGLGKEIYDLAMRNCKDKYEEIFFVDDIKQEKTFYRANVEKFENLQTRNIEFAIANGEPFIREALSEKIKNAGFKLANIIDETAIISPTAKLAEGVVVNANCFISSDAKISCNTYLQPFCIIGHDSSIGSNTVISAFCQISGGCTICDNVYIGIGSSVKERIKVGRGCIIGMGSMVHRDTEELLIVMGNPARPMQKNERKRVFN